MNILLNMKLAKRTLQVRLFQTGQMACTKYGTYRLFNAIAYHGKS